MKLTIRQALMLVAALGAASPACAQHGTSFAIAASGGVSSVGATTDANAVRVQRANGIEYVSGGIGVESRTALQALQPEFPLRVVFSTTDGEYFVADTATVRNDSGQLLALSSVGPILMLKLPPGDYTVNVIYSGRTEQKQIKVGTAAQTVNWRW